jgi:hypothetical protein
VNADRRNAILHWLKGDAPKPAPIPPDVQAWLELTPPMDGDQWLEYGYRMGYCSPPVCVQHDGIPTSEAEEVELEDFGEICTHVVRLYEDAAHKAAVEAEGGPAVWRASNRGWPV